MKRIRNRERGGDNMSLSHTLTHSAGVSIFTSNADTTDSEDM